MLLIVTLLVSLMLTITPGDPAAAILGENATPQQLAQTRASLGLDDPFLVQYWRWLTHALQGDFGTSYRTHQPVLEAIGQRVPVSLELMVLVQFLAIGLAIPAAIYAAYRPGSFGDTALTSAAFGLIATPHFVVGLLLTYLLSVQLGWLPATGFVPLSDGIGPNLRTLILPAIAMAAEPSGVYQRLLRGDLRATLQQDFILAAQAKGMSSFNILVRQALRPSSFSLVTLAGLNTARLIGGMVIVESLFALPGVGRLLIDSINARDIVMVQGIVALVAIAYVLLNPLIDLAYLLLDPRVRDHG